MEKIHAEAKTKKRSYKASRMLLIVAVVVIALSVTVSAAVVKNVGGFTLTGGMSDAEIRALLDDASLAVATEYEDKDGYMHYLDRDGNETLVLSREDAAAYERAKRDRWEQTVKENTTLVNLSTMPLMPNEATELASGKDGHVADFAISNGSLVLLHPEGKDAYELKAGDTVTITLDSNDECILEFGRFKDGVFLDGETVSARQQHSYTFTTEEGGQYCFYVEYYSAGMSAFQNCVIVTD